MRIASLHVYPIKSCRGIDLDEATLVETGLALDREWMLARSDGLFLSQRVLPKMAQIIPTVGDEYLTVNAPGMDELRVPLDNESLSRRPATVWKASFEALDEGDEAATWFSQFLGRDCHLMRGCGDRTLLENHVDGAHNQVGFADGYPILLTSTATLELLNEHLPNPAPMNRFRPNIVVSGDELAAGDEDAWRTIAFSGVKAHIVKPCVRCPIPETDQITGERLNDVNAGLEAVRSGYRVDAPERIGNYFGQNLVHVAPAGTVVKIGDEVTVVEHASQPNVVLTH